MNKPYQVVNLQNGKCVWLYNPVCGEIIKEAMINEFSGIDLGRMALEIHPNQPNIIVLSPIISMVATTN